MRKPQVIKLNKAVAQTAFLLGDSCAYKHDISGLSLTLSRCEKGGEEFIFYPLFVDEYGYVVFEWGKQLNCLEDGFYIGTFMYQCHECKKVFFQVGVEPCEVKDVIHTKKSSCDEIGMSQGSTCCGNAPIEMYRPAYEMKREEING